MYRDLYTPQDFPRLLFRLITLLLTAVVHQACRLRSRLSVFHMLVNSQPSGSKGFLKRLRDVAQGLGCDVPLQRAG